ncbi:hypothetical protein Q5752_001628 [Cryptotrichosporon argae]
MGSSFLNQLLLDIITLVAEQLSAASHLRTLGNVQQALREVYTAVTPALYSHVRLHGSRDPTHRNNRWTSDKLFGTLETLAEAERPLAPCPLAEIRAATDGTHALHLPAAYRLRLALARIRRVDVLETFVVSARLMTLPVLFWALGRDVLPASDLVVMHSRILAT